MDEFFLPPLVSVALASATGASAYALFRPYQGSWYVAIINLFVGMAMGVFLAFSVCEWMGWKTIHQHHLTALGAGLLGMTGARAILATAESEGVAILGRAIKRMIGIQDEQPRLPPEHRSHPEKPGDVHDGEQ